MYEISYIYLSNINLTIDIIVKRNIFNYIINKPKKEIINELKPDIGLINILHSNLKLIIYVENLQLHLTDNELGLLLEESKIKINSYIKKNRKKPINSILEDIKKYNK
jgi:hypothetical protein